MSQRRTQTCAHEGCTAYGGPVWVAAHEKLEHGHCACGWAGAVKNMPWHRSQRVRWSARPEQERELHFLRSA